MDVSKTSEDEINQMYDDGVISAEEYKDLKSSLANPEQSPASNSSNTKKIAKDEENRVLLGVLAGFANYFEKDPLLIRLIFIVGTLLTGIVFGALVYIICGILMPSDHEVTRKLGIRHTVVYPVAILVVGFFLMKQLPHLIDIFEQLGYELPGYSISLFKIFYFVQHNMIISMIVFLSIPIGLIIAFKVLKKRNDDSMLLRILNY